MYQEIQDLIAAIHLYLASIETKLQTLQATLQANTGGLTAPEAATVRDSLSSLSAKLAQLAQ